MKYGKKLLEGLHKPWADHYLQYHDLKKIIKVLAEPDDAETSSFQAEGDFLGTLLRSINKFERDRHMDEYRLPSGKKVPFDQASVSAE